MATTGMKVNLLKNRKVLSEKDYTREKIFFKYTIISLIVVVVITVTMALWNFILSQKLKTIEEQIAEASTKMQGLSEANAEQVYVKNRLALIGKFMDDQAIARESLQKVLALSIPGVSIGGLFFETENEITVSITSENQSALKEALAYYKQSDGYFPQATSLGLSRSLDGYYEMKVTLTLPLKDEKS